MVLASPDASVFSSDMAPQRCKPYFQCLVGLEQLFLCGRPHLRHDMPVVYYQLLLISSKPGDISETVCARQLAKQLKALQESGQTNRIVVADDGDCGHADTEDEILPDPVKPLVPAALPPPPTACGRGWCRRKRRCIG